MLIDHVGENSLLSADSIFQKNSVSRPLKGERKKMSIMNLRSHCAFQNGPIPSTTTKTYVYFILRSGEYLSSSGIASHISCLLFLQREQQQLKSVASKKGPASLVTTPQFEALTKDLKQTCQERDIRIQQLEQELAKVTLELKTTTEKYREFAERESKSVTCSTEDLLTTDESARRSTQYYGFAAQENRSAFANDLIEDPRGPRPQSTEYFGPQNNGYEMHRKQEAPEGPVRNQTPSVCGSPARRNVLSRASVQGLSGKSSAQGYQLPPTPPSAGRGSRGRRNSAGGRYVLLKTSLL